MDGCDVNVAVMHSKGVLHVKNSAAIDPDINNSSKNDISGYMDTPLTYCTK